MSSNADKFGDITFCVNAEIAIEFLCAHLAAQNARRNLNLAASGEIPGDPDELHHQARIDAAEAQHYLGRAAKAAQKENSPLHVLATLGPLLNALELQLDAIRYRAHTPFAEVPYWGDDLDAKVTDWTVVRADRAQP